MGDLMTDSIDAVLCPWTWPQPVGHTHVCSEADQHRSAHRCMCGATTNNTEEATTHA